MSFICVGAEVGMERIGDRVSLNIESGGLHSKEEGVCVRSGDGVCGVAGGVVCFAGVCGV